MCLGGVSSWHTWPRWSRTCAWSPRQLQLCGGLDAALQHCTSYVRYEKAFGGHSDHDAAAHDATDGEPGTAGQPRSEEAGIMGDCAVESFKLNHTITTKVGMLCTDFVFDLLAGQHDPIIKTAVQNTGKDTQWGGLEIPP